jgi:exopolyphosphatase/guanosine-5'-triphosphate,3'-diphosphate pyrophosphatase
MNDGQVKLGAERSSMAGDGTATVAAVDLGSNSFHLIIARLVDGELKIVDRMREQVMLADGLDHEGYLGEQAQARALDCLERIGQRLRGLPSLRVRVVGTNTLRIAKNAAEFRERAQGLLGHPIEIVSGQEEARLIFLGVAHDEYSSAPRLLADIGGGSTEVIVGAGYQVLRSHSLFMGCVNYSKRFFPDGGLKKDRFRKAEIAAALELRTIQHEIRQMGWTTSLGSSGSIVAIAEILRVNGWTEGPITWPGLKKLRRIMIEAGTTEALSLDGLKRERAPVLAGGLAILRAIFRCLELESMRAASGAMREGVLHDLVGRIRHDDIRDHTIRRMVERYRVDLGQATRVEHVALRLLDRLTGEAGLDNEQNRRILVWAAQLHEIGLAVSHTGFHKHGAYLIQFSEMPGFSADDQAMLATVVRTQRRKLSATLFSELPSEAAALAVRLSVVFRLAVLLNRSRSPQEVPEVEISAAWDRIVLRFPKGWAEAHPLTRADLEQEASYLVPLGVQLRLGVRRARDGKRAGPVVERGRRP